MKYCSMKMAMNIKEYIEFLEQIFRLRSSLPLVKLNKQDYLHSLDI